MIKIIEATTAELIAGYTESFTVDGDTTTLSMANVDDVTSGTITAVFAQGGSTVFETPSGPNTIDLSAPTSIAITGSCVGSVKLTLTSYVGTATSLSVAVNSHA